MYYMYIYYGIYYIYCRHICINVYASENTSSLTEKSFDVISSTVLLQLNVYKNSTI